MKNLMKLHTLLLMLFVSTALILGSCKDDDDDIVEGDKTELNALIAQADAIAAAATSADYPQSAIDAFKTTLQTVKDAVATPLTQEQINNLIVQLNAAMETFDSQAYGYIDESLYLNAGWNFDEGSGTTATAYSTTQHVATFFRGNTVILGNDAMMPSWTDGVKGKAVYFNKGAHLEVPYTNSFL
ncbi:MAG: hypothetical protein M9901_13330, partial [Lentimicrobium sp.]|nr:hypothetical protein [Lentimicrobium sp.]